MERKGPVNDLPETAPESRPAPGTGPARYRRGRWKAVVAAHMEELYAESAFLALSRYMQRGEALEDLREARDYLDRLLRRKEREGKAGKERVR